VVEVKTLNSKFLDSIVKLPKVYFDKEIEVKRLITEKLERGKISVNITYARKDDQVARVTINKKLLKSYYTEISGLAEELGAPSEEVFKIVLQYPEVMQTEEPKDKLQDDWKKIQDTLLEAINKCDEFRVTEGATLKKKLVVYVDRIENYLDKVDKKDPLRTNAIKERLQKHLTELENSEKFDPNRFEQEMIYYMEKLDISEEKVRLKSHLDYFLEILNQDDSQGKKLSFLSQEMGREINTMGSKANDAEVQKLVVGMKDELEKIKEQLQNIL
jgi:uncharacterized protein (TIGR00255 family)